MHAQLTSHHSCIVPRCFNEIAWLEYLYLGKYTNLEKKMFFLLFLEFHQSPYSYQYDNNRKNEWKVFF